MRRSKVQRQEERRERRAKTQRRVADKEPKTEVRYTVVRTDDARQGKYLWCAYEGVTLEHAERLAAPVPGQAQRYSVVPVEVHRFAREMGEPVTAPKAIHCYELSLANEEVAA